MSVCAITGMGIISSLGLNVDDFWFNLLAGRHAIEPAFILGESSPIWQSPVGTAFHPEEFVSDPRVLRNASRFSLYALAATTEALKGAGLEELDSERTGVIFGTSMGGVPELVDAQARYDSQGIHKVPARLMAAVIPNMAASQIAMRYQLHGPQLTLSTACASSIDSIGMAFSLISAGVIDVAICGGMENLLTPVVSASLWHAHALSQGERAEEASMPFDQHRTGFVMGEGAAVVILESLAHAQARNVPVLAYVHGYGSLADAYHVTAPEPSGQWEAMAMNKALRSSGFSPWDIDLVMAHGTSTPVGDQAEIRAIGQVYAHAHPIVTSIKGHIGHSMGASGAMSVIAAIKAMHEGRAPHTLGTRELDEEVNFDVVLGEPRVKDIKTVQVNAFGFGGQNASLVIAISQ
ncbi:3-oxoacyl-[acyl-carrier-protein] synthase II [Sulfobacillus thermosulfidooxidans DSM 9293]|uniref:3-oxoacyl-[acyl-carrier-protein] synthase II n=1 Tax=Sulfobacillus thermosulfidooxidans (strain DSM 9293 / VKM B-1269 / AT-1) TaxID=929705 RepID=A0A1W1WD93_SULTA|nr:beta-ketoacyl-[acyl-carrier-protein] synthase family protein [Sulfobacillus thermosulfidooxidans]SMC04010.1 3-oxoacyl-[acyl-carrier-protein] synthase II [Sulfobacillus thermosulfidooxidans DSM 9293]